MAQAAGELMEQGAPAEVVPENWTGS
jgi:hypothetical protein